MKRPRVFIYFRKRHFLSREVLKVRKGDAKTVRDN